MPCNEASAGVPPSQFPPIAGIASVPWAMWRITSCPESSPSAEASDRLSHLHPAPRRTIGRGRAVDVLTVRFLIRGRLSGEHDIRTAQFVLRRVQATAIAPT